VQGESLEFNVNSCVSLRGVSPRGETRQGWGVSLDTSYSTIQTESQFTPIKPRLYCKFVDAENIDFNSKKSNIESLNHYFDVYLPRLGRGLLNRLYCESENIPIADYGNDFVFPLGVYEKYSDLREREENDGLLYYAESTFLKWYRGVKKYSNYVFMSDGDNKSLKRLTNRFDRRYQVKIQERMNYLMWKYGNESSCLVTLTLNPSNFRNSKLCMWETINVLLNEFITEMRKWFVVRGLTVPYIRCIESMKGIKETFFVGRGNPHIHLCFFGVKRIPKKVIDGFWSYGYSFVNSTAKNNKVRYPIHYITKYITKTYTENDADNTLNQSLVWMFNKRSFEHSRGLLDPINVKGCGKWSFDYLVLSNLWIMILLRWIIFLNLMKPFLVNHHHNIRCLHFV
jgi:hypothetical protein